LLSVAVVGSSFVKNRWTHDRLSASCLCRLFRKTVRGSLAVAEEAVAGAAEGVAVAGVLVVEGGVEEGAGGAEEAAGVGDERA
jgi:hypothetical protein